MICESWGYSDTSMPCQMKEGEALKTVDQLKENAGQRYVSAYSFALVYAGSARKIGRFNGSKQSYQERAPYLSACNVDPLLDNLRSDRRFADLVSRIGLPQ